AFPLITAFDADVVSEEISLSSTAAGPWRWTAGAIYRDGKDRNLNEIPGIVTLGWTSTSKSYAVFGELSRRFAADKLEWTLGARYFHDDVVSREDPVAPPMN